MTLALPGIDRLPPERLRQRALGQWDTPPWLAAAIVRDLGDRNGRIDGFHVLEPSAGLGNIVEAALSAGAGGVTAVELDPLRVAHLRARFAGRPVTVILGDFLDVATSLQPVDLIAGNPPYDDGADSDHLAAIADLILRSESRVDPVASLLLRTVAMHGRDRFARVWSKVCIEHIAPVVERVAFGEEAGLIDVSIFSIRRPLPQFGPMIHHVTEKSVG